MNYKNTVKTAFLVFLALSLVASPALGAINWGHSATHNPEVRVDEFIKHKHDMGDSVTTYEDDNGEIQQFPGEVNESESNPYTFSPAHINESEYRKFPRRSDNVTAIDSSEWSVSGTNAAKMAVSDEEVTNGVPGLNVSADGMLAGDTATATFENFTIESDENKRHFQHVLNVPELTADALITYKIEDSDGDYKELEINSSADANQDHVIANSTGSGIVVQPQLGDIATNTVGDGEFNDIEKVTITIVDGDATIISPALNLEKKSTWKFGTQAVDTDGDGETDDTTTLTEPTGEVSVQSLNSLGSTFADAQIRELAFAAILDGEHATKSEMNLTAAEQYANYEKRANQTVWLTIPSAYDISLNSLTLQDEQVLPDNRYISVEYAEGQSEDTGYGDVSDSAWKDVTDSYSNHGATLELDSTLQTGTTIIISYDYVVTGEEAEGMEQEGGAPPVTADNGIMATLSNFADWLMGLPGMILGGLGLGAGWEKRRSAS